MRSTFTLIGVLAVVLLLSLGGVFANGMSFNEPFNNNLANTWYPTVFDGGVQSFTMCGISPCMDLVSDGGQDKYLRFRLSPTTTAGYTDAELWDRPPGDPVNGGPWTPTVGNPVVLEARIRYPGHNFDGSGDAVGTAGVCLWNHGENLNPDYDSLCFVWSQDEFADPLAVDGFTANTTIDLLQTYFRTFRPAPFDVSNWFDVRMVWSVNESGVQTVDYYLNGSLFGTDTLPVALHGLSIVLWQDNSLVDDTFQFRNALPVVEQYFHVDDVKVFVPS